MIRESAIRTKYIGRVANRYCATSSYKYWSKTVQGKVIMKVRYFDAESLHV